MAEEVDHTHGSTGSKPPQDLNFEDGDFPNPEQFDWFWSEVSSAINDHASELESIDANEDGVVDKADNANKLEGNSASDLTQTFSDEGFIDKSDSRSSGTEYTNTSDGFIYVSVILEADNPDNELISFCYINGKAVRYTDLEVAATPARTTESILVPPGAEYRFSVSKGQINNWHELSLDIV